MEALKKMMAPDPHYNDDVDVKLSKEPLLTVRMTPYERRRHFFGDNRVRGVDRPEFDFEGYCQSKVMYSKIIYCLRHEYKKYGLDDWPGSEALEARPAMAMLRGKFLKPVPLLSSFIIMDYLRHKDNRKLNPYFVLWIGLYPGVVPDFLLEYIRLDMFQLAVRGYVKDHGDLAMALDCARVGLWRDAGTWVGDSLNLPVFQRKTNPYKNAALRAAAELCGEDVRSSIVKAFGWLYDASYEFGFEREGPIVDFYAARMRRLVGLYMRSVGKYLKKKIKEKNRNKH